jgi:hypothetical protein
MINFDFGCDTLAVFISGGFLKLNKVDSLWLRWRNIKRGKNVAVYTVGTRTRLR